jgi:hypothetical protein
MITTNALIVLHEIFLIALVKTPKFFTPTNMSYLVQEGGGKQSILASFHPEWN